jgi:molybdopterin molybdotransferase
MNAVDEVVTWLLAQCTTCSPEVVSVLDANGRVVSDEVTALLPSPRWPCSAMDGVALRCADERHAVVRSVLAGSDPGPVLRPGEAVRIMTGAVVPPGADAVVPFERLDIRGDHVELRGSAVPGANIRMSGEDVRLGERVVGAKTVLSAAHLGALSAAGVVEVAVTRRPLVRIIVTGGEVGGRAAAPYGVPDANGPMLRAAVEDSGGTAASICRVGDDSSLLQGALEEARGQCDAIVTTGGLGSGDADHVVRVASCIGSVRAFSLALKPGKPFAAGRLDAALLCCLPGNPAAALVAFELLVRPALRVLGGYRQPLPAPLPAVAGEPFRRRPDGKLHVVRARASIGPTAQLSVVPLQGQGSHQLRLAAPGNALALLADGYGHDAGDLVQVLLLRRPRVT